MADCGKDKDRRCMASLHGHTGRRPLVTGPANKLPQFTHAVRPSARSLLTHNTHTHTHKVTTTPLTYLLTYLLTSTVHSNTDELIERYACK